MSRFSDDLQVVPVGAAPQIFSVPQLRVHLGVSDVPADEQKAAVARWLDGNPASAVLCRSLVEEGWSDLLHRSA